MVERSTINQVVQLGVESTSGTSVAANKLLNCFNFQFGIESDIKYYRGTGRKYASIQELNQEWSSGSMDGAMDFNGIIYPLSSIFGAGTVGASGTSAVAKDWAFTPPLSGNANPKTFTFEQGDAVRAQKLSYGLLQQFGYKGTRKEFTLSGKIIGQLVSDGITMTSSPTAVALAPMVANQFNVYLDDTSANLGTTQLNRPISVEYSMDNVYGPAWFIRRNDPSWTTHVDMEPNATFKLMVEADSQGMGLLTSLRQGITKFVRVDALGGVVDNQQTVSLGSPSAGTFSLTYKGQTASGITYTAAASAVQTALQGLSTIGAGNVTVSGSAGGPYTVSFAGSLANDTTALTGNGGTLTGGTFLVTQTQIYNVFQHDMALKIGKPSPWQDSDGIFAVEWECQVVEDSTWNKAQTVKVTNLLSAL